MSESLPEMRSPFEHVAAEVAWVRLLLRRYCDPIGKGDSGGVPLGAAVEEAAAFLEGGVSRHPLDEEIARFREECDARLRASSLPFRTLCDRLELAAPLRHLLGVLLAVETDPAAARAVRVLHDDPAGRPPDVGFYLRLLRLAPPEAAAVLDGLHPDAPLRAFSIVVMGDAEEPGRPGTERSLMGRGLRLATRVAAWVCGRDGTDERLSPFCEVRSPGVQLDDLFLPDDLVRDLMSLAGEKDGLRLVLCGPRGSGKARVAEAMAGLLGRPLLSCVVAGTDMDHETLRLAFREGWLDGALLYFDCGSGQDSRPFMRSLSHLLDRYPLPAVIGAAGPISWHDRAPRRSVTRFLPVPDAARRRAIWRHALAGTATGPDVSEEYLAGLFSMTPGLVTEAVAIASAAAARRDPVGRVLTMRDLTQACQQVVVTKLSELGQRIPHGFSWADVVLPDESVATVREFLAFARNRRRIFEEWGFARKMPYGRGVSALFHGPPGTGKTMVASLVASELGLPLYRIDLSQVVNKYVGETEKNLARVFDEAQDAGAVLLFDEADALFTRRTEVHSSVDRYANLEVNYLLQRMEDFEGVTVLTTNFDKSLDDAFRRRIKFKVHFPFPGPEERERLWQKLIPPEVPLADPDGVRWDRLARHELAGGYIRNAILRAAIRAADEDRALCEADLEAAAVRESMELGILVRREMED